jgi:hypothetical protein
MSTVFAEVYLLEIALVFFVNELESFAHTYLTRLRLNAQRDSAEVTCYLTKVMVVTPHLLDILSYAFLYTGFGP